MEGRGMEDEDYAAPWRARPLSELEATFVRCDSPDGGSFREGVTLAEAQGVMFDCPQCGRHSILCWSRSAGAPDAARPGPGRWALSGSSLEDLTLAAEPGRSASVLLTGGCKAHFWVRGGLAVNC